jgi:hypothetical protein
VIINAWDSIEAYQASLKKIPPKLIVATMQLLTGARKVAISAQREWRKRTSECITPRRD